YESFTAWLADQSTTNRTRIRALRRLVARTAPDLEESVKWGNGCWVKDGVPVAYAHAKPDHVQFGFFRGAALDDPRGLLHGKGAYVRHVPVRRYADLDEAALVALLRQAVQSAPPPAQPVARRRR